MRDFLTRRLLVPCVVAGLVVILGCVGTGEAHDNQDQELVMVRDSLGIDEFRQRQARRVEDLLVGQVAGVRVRHTSAGLQVEIRGPSSFRGSSEPLYVIDGMPIKADPGGSLRGINPHDIKSIRVLKNPSDTSMYGVRGANGVVIITTKGSAFEDD